ncbi:MAG: glycosyltransferase family 2 protein [Elusimicrobiota bacterium]
MAAPFFSVVIDNYNYGRYLKAAIDSVLAQDFPRKDVELIVVDDGSTDQSREIIASYGAKVRGILQPNCGQATAFNRGFSEAKGRFVCLLDSDDVWRPEKLSSIAPLFDDPKVGQVEHFLEDTDVALNPLPQSFPAWPERYVLDDFLKGQTHWTATSGLCFRKTNLDKALPIPKDLFYYLDDFLSVRVLFDSEAANLPKVLGAHRVHGGNWCAGGYESPRKLEVDFRMREIFAEHLDRWLAEYQRFLDPAFTQRQDLEVFRRKVLYQALCARPVEAWQAWWEGFLRLRGTSFSAFRLASVLLAVLSPTLYLSAYSSYAQAGRLKDLRLRLFND